MITVGLATRFMTHEVSVTVHGAEPMQADYNAEGKMFLPSHVRIRWTKHGSDKDWKVDGINVIGHALRKDGTEGAQTKRAMFNRSHTDDIVHVFRSTESGIKPPTPQWILDLVDDEKPEP